MAIILHSSSEVHTRTFDDECRLSAFVGETYDANGFLPNLIIHNLLPSQHTQYQLFLVSIQTPLEQSILWPFWRRSTKFGNEVITPALFGLGRFDIIRGKKEWHKIESDGLSQLLNITYRNISVKKNKYLLSLSRFNPLYNDKKYVYFVKDFLQFEIRKDAPEIDPYAIENYQY